MSRQLNCAKCNKHMATLRDASVRKGMVVYCVLCDPVSGNQSKKEFDRIISTIFGGRLK